MFFFLFSHGHCVFTVTVHLKKTSELGEEYVMFGKLNIVDLVGGENVCKGGPMFDKQVREVGRSNQSLLAFHRVILSLINHANHVPFRYGLI